MFNKIKKLKNFLSNIRWYWNILWNDYSYDYHSVYVILDKKLKKMQKYFEYDKSIIEGDHFILNEIEQARIYLKVLISGNNLDYIAYFDNSITATNYSKLYRKIEKYAKENHLNISDLIFSKYDEEKINSLPPNIKYEVENLNTHSDEHFRNWHKFLNKTRKSFFNYLQDNIENWRD